MYYKVVNIKTGKRELLDEFTSKTEAEQAIVNTIRGASDKKEALKYYRTMTVRKE